MRYGAKERYYYLLQLSESVRTAEHYFLYGFGNALPNTEVRIYFNKYETSGFRAWIIKELVTISSSCMLITAQNSASVLWISGFILLGIPLAEGFLLLQALVIVVIL